MRSYFFKEEYLIKQRIIWAICLFGIFAFLFFSGNRFALILLLLFAIVPIVLTVVNQFVARNVCLSLEVPQIVDKNRYLTCYLKAKNAKRLPLSPIVCRIRCENILTGEKAFSEIMFPLGAKKECTIPFSMKSIYCGCVFISVDFIKIYDGFGLFAYKAQCDTKAELSVLPTTFAPHITVLSHMAKDVEADEYSQEKAGCDPSETFAIREYRPGDSLQRIHWKLSNKFDELLIKEPGLPVLHSYLVLLETSVPYGIEAKADVNDAMAEILLSLTQAMTEEEITYEIGWQDHDSNSFFLSRVTSMEELTGVVNKLLRTRHVNNDVDALTSYIEEYGENSFEHILYISPHLPNGFDQLVGDSQTTAIICTKDTNAAQAEIGMGSWNLYFCAPENYEKELYALSI